MEEYKSIGVHCGEDVRIKFLKEVPTEWEDMIEYLKGEKIINPKTIKDKGYNKGLDTAISMIGSCYAQLKDIK